MEVYIKYCRIYGLGCIADALHNLLMAEFLKNKDMKRVRSLRLMMMITIGPAKKLKYDLMIKNHSRNISNGNSLQQ